MRVRSHCSSKHLLHKVDVHERPVEQALAQVLGKHRRRLPVLELPRQVVHPKVHTCSACSGQCELRVSALWATKPLWAHKVPHGWLASDAGAVSDAVVRLALHCVAGARFLCKQRRVLWQSACSQKSRPSH